MRANVAFAPSVVPAGERARPDRRRIDRDERLREDDELGAVAGGVGGRATPACRASPRGRGRPARPGRTRRSRSGPRREPNRLRFCHGEDLRGDHGQARRVDGAAAPLLHRVGAARRRRPRERVAEGRSSVVQHHRAARGRVSRFRRQRRGDDRARARERPHRRHVLRLRRAAADRAAARPRDRRAPGGSRFRRASRAGSASRPTRCAR